jgi:hypothetical protein
MLRLLSLILLLITMALVMVQCATSSKSYERIDDLPRFNPIREKISLRSSFIRLKDEQERFFCSAFVIDDNYALTAAHCIVDEFNTLKKDIPINVYDLNNIKTIVAYPASVNKRRDLGLVIGDFRGFNSAVLDESKIEFKEDYVVTSCGFPFGQQDLYCPEITIKGNTFFGLRGKGIIFPGMSGGPVLYNGKVVAVNSAVAEDHVILMPLIGALSSLGVK